MSFCVLIYFWLTLYPYLYTLFSVQYILAFVLCVFVLLFDKYETVSVIFICVWYFYSCLWYLWLLWLSGLVPFCVLLCGIDCTLYIELIHLITQKTIGYWVFELISWQPPNVPHHKHNANADIVKLAKFGYYLSLLDALVWAHTIYYTKNLTQLRNSSFCQ